MAKPSGRPPLPLGEALTEFLYVRVSTRELVAFDEACDALDLDRSAATREAINEFVSDFQERRIFERRRKNEPVAVDRRRGDRRRASTVMLVDATAPLTS